MVSQNKTQRDIKFRAWDDYKKRMFEVKGLKQTPIGTWEVWDGKVSILPCNIYLMFFTGLWDKNNVRIYEGDIVRGMVTGNYPALIECDAPNGGYNIRDKNGEYIEIDSNTRIEVIGNIYEHNYEEMGKDEAKVSG